MIMIKPQNTGDTQELVCYLANKLESYHVELKFIKMNESLGPKVLLIIIENYGKKTIESVPPSESKSLRNCHGEREGRTTLPLMKH